MKNFYIHISSLIIVVLVFMSSCQHKPNTTIAQALLLAGEHPDSALALLNNMQFSKLGKSEQAKYAVVYTMAQDKSGLDVDEDSLIRIGYNGMKSIQKIPFMQNANTIWANTIC